MIEPTDIIALFKALPDTSVDPALNAEIRAAITAYAQNPAELALLDAHLDYVFAEPVTDDEALLMAMRLEAIAPIAPTLRVGDWLTVLAAVPAARTCRQRLEAGEVDQQGFPGATANLGSVVG